MEKYNKQIWYCNECKKHGEVKYREHADVMSVVHLLGNHHKAISPNCENGTYGLKVVKDERTLKGLTKKVLLD